MLTILTGEERQAPAGELFDVVIQLTDAATSQALVGGEITAASDQPDAVVFEGGLPTALKRTKRGGLAHFRMMIRRAFTTGTDEATVTFRSGPDLVEMYLTSASPGAMSHSALGATVQGADGKTYFFARRGHPTAPVAPNVVIVEI